MPTPPKKGLDAYISFGRFEAKTNSYKTSTPLLFRFIAVPAKWVRTARQYKLNIYSAKPYNIIWEHG